MQESDAAAGGAAPPAVKLFLRQGLMLAGIGLTIGLAGSLALTRRAAEDAFGIRPEDPLTILTVAMVAAADKRL